MIEFNILLNVLYNKKKVVHVSYVLCQQISRLLTILRSKCQTSMIYNNMKVYLDIISTRYCCKIKSN